MIVFLICFLIISLLVCEKAYWFVELRFWHPIKLMNSCNISNFFVRNVYVLLCTKSHYLQMKITCPLLISLPWFFLNSIALDSNFISKKSVENGHSCSVPDIKRNYFSFSPLSIMLAVGFSWVFITLWRYISSTHRFCVLDWRNIEFCQINLLRQLYFLCSLLWWYGVLQLLICVYWATKATIASLG
jgi:hypothetical protein